MALHISRQLAFWVNYVDNIHLCHRLKPSRIIFLCLVLTRLPLIFPVVTMSQCLFPHYMTKERFSSPRNTKLQVNNVTIQGGGTCPLLSLVNGRFICVFVAILLTLLRSETSFSERENSPMQHLNVSYGPFHNHSRWTSLLNLRAAENIFWNNLSMDQDVKKKMIIILTVCKMLIS